MYDFHKLARGHPEITYELSLKADGETFTTCKIVVIGGVPVKLELLMMQNLTSINEDDERNMLELAEALIGYGGMIKGIVNGEPPE